MVLFSDAVNEVEAVHVATIANAPIDQSLIDRGLTVCTRLLAYFSAGDAGIVTLDSLFLPPL